MLLDASKATLLVVDVQERLLPAMAAPEAVVDKTKILIQAAQTLGVPITVSEQYPKGLGATVKGLAPDGAAVFEKLSFSCWRDEGLKTHFIRHHEAGRPLVVVAGIEAHVCVLQTCIDLASAGFGVFAVCDAMSSRKHESVGLALDRMRHVGIEVVNTEMALFELIERAGTPEFKTLSAMIRQLPN
jgi:nicotinamidase-related amidase